LIKLIALQIATLPFVANKYFKNELECGWSRSFKWS